MLRAHQRAKAARITALRVLASPRAELGSLVRSVLKVFGMLPRLQPDSLRHRRLVEVEETGRNARTAVGIPELPLDIAVEIEMVVAVDASA